MDSEKVAFDENNKEFNCLRYAGDNLLDGLSIEDKFVNKSGIRIKQIKADCRYVNKKFSFDSLFFFKSLLIEHFFFFFKKTSILFTLINIQLLISKIIFR